MDALKKAEEEKKKAAKRLEQVEVDARADISQEMESDSSSGDMKEASTDRRLTETVKLSLEPIDEKVSLEPSEEIESVNESIDTPADEKLIDSEEDLEATSKISIADISLSDDITMQSTVAESITSDQSFEQTQKNIDLADTTIIEGLSSENVSAPFDDTFHGVIFDAEEDSPEVYEETLPGVPAEQLIKDIGGGDYQPTPVAAQTVFTAGRTKGQNKSSWGIFIVLAILAFGSFGVFYYFTITPVARKLPSPIVARGIESSPVPGIAAAKVQALDVISGTIIGPDQATVDTTDTNHAQLDIPESVIPVEQNLTANPGEVPVVVEEVVEEVATSNIEINNLTAEASDDNKIVGQILEVETTSPVIEDKPEELTIEPTRDQMADNIVSPKPELLNISKNANPLKQNVLISEAFKTYQAGDLITAEKMYNDALRENPDNRDIHLGLAAIALNKGDRGAAYAHYLKLLELNSTDAFALSSLISLSNNTDPVKDESVLKNLIQKEAKSPYLYFALGNIYAKQLRWAEAQQAFFNAYTLDSENPDYVLNLAVSLDKIGQYSTALNYYNLAIELSQDKTARFNPSSVNARIQALKNVEEKVL